MEKFKKISFDILSAVAGCILCSIAINMFSAPNNIIQGGLTGIAVIIKSFYPAFPIGIGVFTMNIPLFILAKIFLNKGTLSKSLFNTLLFTLAVDIGSLFIKPYMGDKLLSTVFCAVLAGAGLALVFLGGGSTGGTDIIALLLKKRFKKLSLGRIILFLDLLVITATYFAYGEIEAVMYAAVTTFLSSRVIDTLLYGSGHGKLIFIVSEKGEEIKDMIFSFLHRGVTVVPAKGGFTGQNKEILLCAARANEIRNIGRIINSCDEKAFTVVCDAGDIFGKGFTDI